MVESYSTNRKSIVRVSDVMKDQFDMIDGMLTIKEALIGMKYVENKCLIVEKRHDDDEYGLLLISDIARKVLAKDRALDRVNVYEVMQKPVIAVTPNMDIRYCARLLDQFNITRTPVIDGDEVRGIVSFTDLVIRGMSEQLDA